MSKAEQVARKKVKKILLGKEQLEPRNTGTTCTVESLAKAPSAEQNVKPIEVEIVLFSINLTCEGVGADEVKLCELEVHHGELSALKIPVTVEVKPIDVPCKPLHGEIKLYVYSATCRLEQVIEELRDSGVSVKPLRIEVPWTAQTRSIELSRLESSIGIKLPSPPRPSAQAMNTRRECISSSVSTIAEELEGTKREEKEGKKIREEHVSLASEGADHGVSLYDLWIELSPEGLVDLSGRVVDGRPKIVLAYKPKNFDYYDYILFLAAVLRDLYRITRGDKPSMHYIARKSELDDYDVFIKASGSITVIDVEALQATGCTLTHILSVITSRAKELVSQDQGFIVIYASKENMGRIIGKLSEIFGTGDGNKEGSADIVPIRINEGKKLEDYYKLVSAYYGMVDADNGGSISSYARKAESMLYKNLERILDDYDVLLKLEESPTTENEANESTEHLLLKALVLKYLKEQGVDLNKVTCEKTLENNITVDIYDEENNRIIEIETLYGTRIPELKIRKTITTRADKASELWIVMPNSSLLLWGPRIAKLIRELHKRRAIEGTKVKLYGVNFSNKHNPRIEEYSKIVARFKSWRK